jgi:hypothetical protein
MEKCLYPEGRDGKRTFWRFATVREAQKINFRTASRSAYGISSPRKHLNEFSKKDLLSTWEKELNCFNLYAQPIEDWAQMPQTITRLTAKVTPISNNGSLELVNESRTYRELRTQVIPGASKIDIRVHISQRELWILDEKTQDEHFGKRLISYLVAQAGLIPRFGLEITAKGYTGVHTWKRETRQCLH